MRISNKKHTIIKIVTLFIMLFSVSVAFSQNEKHPIDIKNRQCIENSVPTTAAAMKCADEALKAWKTEMNTNLKLLKTKNTIIDTLLLQETQKKWLIFHNADVTLYNSHLRKLYQGGTLGRVAIITYKKEGIRKRALSLKAFYEDLDY